MTTKQYLPEDLTIMCSVDWFILSVESSSIMLLELLESKKKNDKII